MIASKHTPGPWEFGPNHSSTGLAGQLVVRPAGEFPHGEWVADVGSMYDDHREANARLIAAAPDLLEVVKVARARIELERDVFVDCNTYPDGSLLQANKAMLDSLNSLLARIDAAIAKAGGSMSETLPQKSFIYTWSSELQCGWNAWHAVDDGVLHLHLQPGHCCDMSGAIRVAESMMPLVWRIVTFSGKTQDVEYKNVRGKWTAYKPAKFPSRRKESP